MKKFLLTLVAALTLSVAVPQNVDARVIARKAIVVDQDFMMQMSVMDNGTILIRFIDTETGEAWLDLKLDPNGKPVSAIGHEENIEFL